MEILKLNASRQNGLDAAKCVAAFMVVWIHYGWDVTDSTSIIHGICISLNGICRIGVGMFFFISGYYYPRLVERGRFRSHIKKMIKITVAATLLYFLWYTVKEADLISFRSLLRGVMKLVIFNLPIWGFHLWYLFAVIYVMIVMRLCDKLCVYRALVFISALLLIVGCVLHNTVFPPSYTRNFLFYGLPFVMGGRLLYEHENDPRIANVPNTYLWSVTVICMLSIVAQVLLFNKRYDFFPLMLPATACLFIICKRIKSMGALGKIISVIGMKYSALIYIFHILVCDIYDMLFFRYADPVVVVVLRPFMAFILSIALSVVWVKLWPAVSRFSPFVKGSS